MGCDVAEESDFTNETLPDTPGRCCYTCRRESVIDSSMPTTFSKPRWTLADVAAYTSLTLRDSGTRLSNFASRVEGGLRRRMILPARPVDKGWYKADMGGVNREWLRDYADTIPRGPLRHRIAVLPRREDRVVDGLPDAAAHLSPNVGIIDVEEPQWLSQVLEGGYDGAMVRIGHSSVVEREISRERLATLRDAGVPSWPNPLEADLYENKRRLAGFLEANDLPRIPTVVLTSLDSALEHMSTRSYPAVVKLDCGSGGRAVWRVSSPEDGRAIARLAFGRGLAFRGKDGRDSQSGSILVQDFLDVDKEVRINKIGRNWAGLEKLRASGWRHSGSGRVDLERPADIYFDMADQVFQRFGFNCMSVDFLVTGERAYISELQTWFGSYRAAQMTYKGVPGYLTKRPSGWTFSAGIINVHRGWTQRLLAMDAWLTEEKRNPRETPVLVG